MKNYIPSVLANFKDTRIAVDAIYFVMRAIRNADRGYQNIMVSPEASPEAYELAKLAIREIEASEHAQINELSNDQMSKYIEALEKLQRTTYISDVGSVSAKAMNILNEMRASQKRSDS